ncbi:MAG TPA: lysozyme inhibitor LprI family protein, partial [Thiobacillus sp.]|nr:lysozyme inhibitor LprI family protein [Thiobacillus sp.]
MRKLLSISGVVGWVAAIFSVTAYADCSSPGTTLEINDCLLAEYNEADAKLNATYQRVMRGFSKPDQPGHIHYAEAKENLIEAQRAWIKYRDKDCYAVYALAVGASMRGQLSLQCKRGRTEQRIKELE